MMRKFIHIILGSLVLLLISGLFSSAKAGSIVLKYGTVAPRGTSISIAVEMLQDMYNYKPFQELMGEEIKVTVYWGAIQGDEPQMIQKAKMGQLDCISVTPLGLPFVCRQLEPLMMAYLITDYGEFDYVMYTLKKQINRLYYDNGWVVLNLAVTEGPHFLFIPGPYKEPEELRKNLVSGNYSGGADDTFFKAMDIPQTAVNVSDAYMMFRQGQLNGGISSALMSIGMQMYLNLKYMILPPIRMVPNSFALTKNRFDKLPWRLKAFYIVSQPFMYYGGGVLHDSAGAFYDSLLKAGVKEIKLNPDELKVWLDKVFAYRKVYLGNDKQKNDLYEMVMKAKNEYINTNPIEMRLFKNDPSRKNIKDRWIKLAKAIESYQTTGSLEALKSLEQQLVIENWRVYAWVAAAENYMKTGKSDELKKWMGSFFIEEIVDELFSKHPDVIKALFGSRKSVNAILGSYRKYLEYPGYKGYQNKGGLKIQ